MSLADDLTKLEELRRSGALTESEFVAAKGRLLAAEPAPAGGAVADKLAEQLAETRYQNELARIDREWQIERERYMIAGKTGRHLPTAGEGLVTAVVGGVFGVFWTVMAFSMTSGAPDFGPFAIANVVMPLFGVVFTVGAIGLGIYAMNKAQAYNQAFAAYQRRRAAVKRTDFR